MVKESIETFRRQRLSKSGRMSDQKGEKLRSLGEKSGRQTSIQMREAMSDIERTMDDVGSWYESIFSERQRINEEKGTEVASYDPEKNILARILSAPEEQKATVDMEGSTTGMAVPDGGEGLAAKPTRPTARRDPEWISKLSDREILARTIQAEAGQENYEGKLAVGAVIDTRSKSDTYGGSIKGAILKPGQFSPWNSVTGFAGGEQGVDMERIKPSKDAYKAADAILSGNYESPVGDATHFYNPDISTPAWGKQAGGSWKRIGGHIFGSADKKR